MPKLISQEKMHSSPGDQTLGEDKLKGLRTGLRTGNKAVGVLGVCNTHILICSQPCQAGKMLSYSDWVGVKGLARAFRWVSQLQGLRESWRGCRISSGPHKDGLRSGRIRLRVLPVSCCHAFDKYLVG